MPASICVITLKPPTSSWWLAGASRGTGGMRQRSASAPRHLVDVQSKQLLQRGSTGEPAASRLQGLIQGAPVLVGRTADVSVPVAGPSARALAVVLGPF